MRKLYDIACTVCKSVEIDRYVDLEALEPCRKCGEPMERVLFAGSTVISDEIDLTTKHIDGVERRFTSKAELRKALTARGLTNAVWHVTSRESDKSRHTSRWN